MHIAHSGHAPREPPIMSQAGLRTREWRILSEGRHLPEHPAGGITSSFRLAYRCVGSAGMVIPLECFTGFPFHPAAACKLWRDT